MAKQRQQKKNQAGETVRRGQGRPRASDGIDGAEQLLLAARRLLATTHPDQMTQVMVAKEASVDSRLVRYYFGNMDNLLFDLTKSLIKDIDTRMSEASNIEGTVFDKLEKRIKVLLRFYIENPMFWPLMLEYVYLSEEDEATNVRRTYNRASYHRLETILLKGIDENLIRREIDPRFLYMFLIGACEIFVTGKPISDILFSRYEQDDLEESYGRFLSDVVLRGLRAAPVD